MKRSKPEWMPDELVDGIATGFEMAELKANGARFEYPDGLSSFQWMALTALNRGSARAREQDRKLREAGKRK